MTVNEYASFENSSGSSVACVDGTWWRTDSPFFYRPLIPYAEIDPHKSRYPLLHIIGGVQHAVPVLAESNSNLNYFIYDHLQEYSLQLLSPGHRAHIRRGMNNFSIRPIVDKYEFMKEGYPCYLSFYERTRYSYRNDRKVKSRFDAWADILFRDGNVLKIGAYRDGRLAGIHLSHRVEDCIYYQSMITDSRFLHLHISDALNHTMREYAAQTNAQLIFMGRQTGIRGIDEFKMRRGCRYITKPAYYKLNELVLYLLRNYRSDQYLKLMGIPSM